MTHLAGIGNQTSTRTAMDEDEPASESFAGPAQLNHNIDRNNDTNGRESDRVDIKKCHTRASEQVRWPTTNNFRGKKEEEDDEEEEMPNSQHTTRIRLKERIRNSTSIVTATTIITTISLVLLLNLAKQTNSYQLANNLIANNLPPKFISSSSSSSAAAAAATNSEIVVRVKEGPASIGRLIYTLKGEDPDDDPLTFGVLGSMASDLLRIENVPGNQANVYLRKELDRETTESYQMVITLTDGKLGRGNWITKSMLIIVEDINDNYPVFGPHKAAISLREDTKVPLVIETVEASDQDEGRFGQVIYKLEELDDNQQQQQQPRSVGNMFAIETVDGKGVISLIQPLDYEQKALYQLRVIAIDRAVEQERLSTSANILISVEDCPDNPPMFTFVPSITRVPEDLAIGSPVVRVAAIDGDRGINNPIEYKIISANSADNPPFAIEPDTGQISVVRELDREAASNQQQQSTTTTTTTSGRSSSQPGSYVIQVQASELVGGKSDDEAPSVSTELTIILTDVNDELPTFERSHYFGEILENSAPESLVSFIGGPPAAAATTPDATGGGSQPLPGVIAKVIDRDQGTNGTFTLHLEGEQAHLFDVWPREATNEATLMVKISSAATASQLAQLDFERNKVFQFQVVAREKYGPHIGGRQRSSSAQMSVYLKDFNDNYPQFDQELYRVEIPENAIRGMHICAVKATDLDSGIYGTAGIRYTELRGEKANKFKLDPISGVITLKTNEHGFDRETMAQHHLIVEARDANGQGNRNTTQLLIVLTDVNDQRPKFLLDQYEAFIHENELDFQSPLQVQAVDNDAPNSGNSRIIYSIVGGDPQQNFTIDPLTGRIRVRSSLIMSSPAPPPGNNAARSPADQDNTVLDEQHQSPPGTAQVAGLDFERIAQKQDDTRQFNLTIKASDSGLPEPLFGLTNVIVLVYDKNDHAPVFSRNVYTKSIREDAREGSQVVQVLAQDGDHSPTNSRITYRISSGASDKFVIDSETGLISVANGANLDIDRAAGGQKRTNYLLNVVAFDGSFGPNQKTSSALVNITITDVNNKPPEFVTLGQTGAGSRYLTSGAAATTISPPGGAAIHHHHHQQQQQQLMVVYVNEDAPYGFIVTRVVATDLDSSAELRYSINYARSEARNEDMILVDPSLVKDLFSIDPTDGTIKVSKQLDRELFDQVKLRLQVEDIAGQTADQVAHTNLLIKITDVNDNRPSYKKPVYKAVVNENSISGTSVITLTADDRDLNKTLKYSLDGAPELMRLVRINPRSGEITVNDKIDRELYSMINVTVRAEDYGHPIPLTGTTQLLITVRDENDNNPVFLANNSISPVSYDLTSVYDSSSSSSYGNHNMNDSTTTTTTSGPRHRSLGGHHHRSLAGIGNLLGDDSLQNLVFLSPGSTAMVREDAPIGHQIAFVKADDADMGNNGRVTYLLDATSSGGGKFRIDRDTGIISVAGPLDRETVKQYKLIIEACDNYDLGYSTGESRRAFTQVNILVSDINDNAPLISTNLQPQISSAGAAAAASTELLSSQADGSGISLVATNPSYEDVMNSPGPFEMPLADCLFISEFQALNEPILTITAIDADDPSTPNGLVDLAIVNQGGNLPQSDLFALVPSAQRPPSSRPTTTSTVSSISDSHLASTSSAATATDDDEIGFAGSSNAAASSDSGESRTPPPTPTTVINTSDEASMESTVSGELASRQMAADELSTPIQLDDGRTMVLQRRRRSAASRAHQQTFNTPRARLLQPQQTHRPRENLSAFTDPERPSGSSSSISIGRASGPSASQPQVVSESTGEHQVHLVVTQSLKEKVGNYSILIRATDRGQPQPLSSAKLINICVQDVNNHAPVFVRPSLNHTIRVMENATIGSYVTQVSATDADHGQNGELQYSLKPTNIQNSNNDWQSFKIDRLTGVISTNKLFNRQVKKYYTLRVQAQDFGKPTMLSNDIDVNIMIVNSGHYQPEFEQQHQQLQFTENVGPGVEWFTLIETNNLEDDPALIHSPESSSSPSTGGVNTVSSSSSNNKWLTSPCYFIIDSDDQDQVFHLDRYTHRLSNRKLLDREKKSNYTLLIQATNQCSKVPSAPIYAPPRPATPNGGDLATTGLTTASPLDESLIMSTNKPSIDQNHFEYRSGSLSMPARSKRSAPSLSSSNRTTAVVVGTNGVAAKLTSGTTSDDPIGSEIPVGFSQMAVDSLLAADKSLLKVVIKVKDVNDNAPKFTQKVYTGGITTEADFGTTFMIVQAIDADADVNSQVVYSIVKPIKSRNQQYQSTSNQAASTSAHKFVSPLPSTSSISTTRHRRSPPSPGTTLPPSTTSMTNKLQESTAAPIGDNFIGDIPLAEGDDLFMINPQTGEISLNFDPQRHMKGYFEFEIMANDTDGLFDQAKVFIYLLRQDQRVKFVLRLTPQELRQRLNKFRSVFGNITGAIVNIDSYKYYENHDGTVDKKKTSLYLHFVQPDDNTIIDVDKVLTLIDNNIEYLDELYKEFHVLSSEAAHMPLSSSALIDPMTDQIRTGLLGVSSFLALILVLVIVLCVNQRTRYERQLKAATVSAFGSSPLHLGGGGGGGDASDGYHSQTNLPNTNLHSQDPNPIWMNGFVSEQDWLTGGSGGGQKPKVGGCSGGGGREAAARQAAALDIEACDYLSSAAENDDSDDLNSLGAAAVNQSVSHLHYNVAATATPRDSLNSSHGRVSGSGSGSGSSSTTNDRQFLCSANGRSQTPQKVTLPQSAAKQTTRQQKPELVGVLKNSNNNPKRSQIATPTDCSHSSTFGAFKEVTIYTEQPSNHQFSRATDKQSAVRNQHQKTQKQQASQVNKIASQFNAKHLQASANDRHKVPQSFGVNQQQQIRQPPTITRQQQHQRVLVHANGTDVSQGIIKTTATKQPITTTLTGMVNNQRQISAADPNVTNYQINNRDDSAAEQFESNLSKLSILNLETTEL